MQLSVIELFSVFVRIKLCILFVRYCVCVYVCFLGDMQGNTSCRFIKSTGKLALSKREN